MRVCPMCARTLRDQEDHYDYRDNRYSCPTTESESDQIDGLRARLTASEAREVAMRSVLEKISTALLCDDLTEAFNLIDNALAQPSAAPSVPREAAMALAQPHDAHGNYVTVQRLTQELERVKARLAPFESIQQQHAAVAANGAGVINRPQGPCECTVCQLLQ